MKSGLKQTIARCAVPMLALLLPAALRAQQRPLPDDTTRVVLQIQADSLAAEPQVPAAIDSARLEWLRTPPTVRDLVCDRVGCIETDVPHQFNNAVMSYVTLFTARNRGYMQRVLERENFYFPIFEKYLAQYHLPTDLKYLAVVESALIPTAKSPVGATGLWQFMGPTAGDLKLRRDEWVDERMAPEKATEAACKHLRYLYGIFHDWELVLAAYNWGAGSVQRVMHRTGQKTFWDLYPYMPAETRNYVPTFTAIMYSMKYAQMHGLHSDKLTYQHAEALDTLGLKGQPFDLRRLSRALGYTDSLALLRFNPELRRAGLPAGYRPYVLHYPAAARPNLGGADYTTLVRYCAPPAAQPQPLRPLPPRLDGVAPWPQPQELAATAGPREAVDTAAPRFRRVAHKVRRGETLASVAEQFEVSAAQLRHWNGLAKGSRLRPGQQVLAFVALPVVAARPVVAAAVASPAAAGAAAGAMAGAAAGAAAAAERVALPEELPLVAGGVAGLSATEAVARRELAAANTREIARLAAVAEQERWQQARLAQLRERQELARRAAARIAAVQAKAEAQAVALAARVAAAERVSASKQAIVRAQAERMAAENAGITPAEATDEEAAAALPEGAAGASAAAVPTASKGRETAVAPTRPRRGHLLVERVTLTAKSAEKPADKVAGKPEKVEKPATGSYTVQPGDYLTKLARERGLSVAQLVAWNRLETETVVPGQRLHLTAPAGGEAVQFAPASGPADAGISKAKTHQVQPGDTLYNISRRFGVSVQQLRELNHLTTDEVQLGQKLLVPQG